MPWGSLVWGCGCRLLLWLTSCMQVMQLIIMLCHVLPALQNAPNVHATMNSVVPPGMLLVFRPPQTFCTTRS